jgi:hypothetical protein
MLALLIDLRYSSPSNQKGGRRFARQVSRARNYVDQKSESKVESNCKKLAFFFSHHLNSHVHKRLNKASLRKASAKPYLFAARRYEELRNVTVAGTYPSPGVKPFRVRMQLTTLYQRPCPLGGPMILPVCESHHAFKDATEGECNAFSLNPNS